MRRPQRIDGYAPIRDYAAIGDGRVAALVALDGSIDWLCLPEFDSPSVFGALLDAERGGRFALAPTVPFEAERRYVEGTNVLETTFRTDDGVVRVTDAVNLEAGALLPWRELARRVEGVSGSVEIGWRVEPGFDFGRGQATIERHQGVPFAVGPEGALGLLSFDAGEPGISADAIEGRFRLEEGSRALLVGVHHGDQPRAIPEREEIERRIDATCEFWRHAIGGVHYDGRWPEAVRRSVLALRLLTYTETGAMAAAASCSLPERIGGSRNWDYRFSWLRDTALSIDALLRLRMTIDGHRALLALLEMVEHTHPRLQPIYSLRGKPRIGHETLPLHGYRGSQPVQVGNSAEGQLQLGNFADFAQAVYRYVEEGQALDPLTGTRLAEVADLVCHVWRHDDAGLWELSDRPYTVSKMQCWLTLDHAVRLARRDLLPRDHVPRWEVVKEEIRGYVESRCWSERRRSYTFYADSDDVDVSVLVAIRAGYAEPDDPRVLSTIDALRDELARGPLYYRYSGMSDKEGAFLACSFWVAEALAAAGRVEEATELMDDLVGLANDVGLYSEQMDPDSREMLGNFPQAITHLALLGAASALEDAERRAGGGENRERRIVAVDGVRS